VKAPPSIALSATLVPVSGGVGIVTVSVTNQNGSACAPSSFLLTPSVPNGWSATLVLGTLVGVSPGATASTVLRVTPPASAAAGSYTVPMRVTEIGNPANGASQPITVVVPARHPPSRSGSYATDSGE
jgi:hypothetical protein